MRIYLAADAPALKSLRDGGSVTLPAIPAESDDEADEFAALSKAAENGAAVVVAEVGRTDQPVTLSEVEALHVDADGTGDLAWYATQEIDAVIELLG
ncbi:hypothetical protein [Aeromicrobium sp.]|uniref:hypothetical protein n=1 Tax=Aeromicrobium sp. TaxID=1871063 RepID=UPI003D6B4E50